MHNNERTLSMHYDHHPGFVFLKGTTPILVSAPHAVVHERDNKLKYAEPETAQLAQDLHAHHHVSAIWKTDHDMHDANSEDTSYFRDTIVDFIEKEHIICGIDLHQCSPQREQDLIIGTGKGKNVFYDDYYATTIETINKSYHLNIVIDEIFPALGNNRVSTDVSSRTRIPYLQVEINSKLLLQEEQYGVILSFLADFISCLEK